MYIIYNLQIIYNIVFAGLMQQHTVQPVLSDSQRFEIIIDYYWVWWFKSV